MKFFILAPLAITVAFAAHVEILKDLAGHPEAPDLGVHLPPNQVNYNALKAALVILANLIPGQGWEERFPHVPGSLMETVFGGMLGLKKGLLNDSYLNGVHNHALKARPEVFTQGLFDPVSAVQMWSGWYNLEKSTLFLCTQIRCLKTSNCCAPCTV